MHPRRHFIIPDAQVKPGVPTVHFDWIGKAIREYHPDVVVHLGDHWDFESLSGYASPKEMEGQRYEDDVKAGNDALYRLDAAMGKFRGRKVLLRGNHEDRLTRAIAANPKWAGAIGFHQFVDRRLGWEVVDYFQGSPQPIVIDGVTYCLTPDHRVLTKDLRYKPLGEIVAGEEIVGFDEDGAPGEPRRFKTAVVRKVDRAEAPVFAVTMESGKVFRTTADHRWLARKYGRTDWQWVHTRDIRGYEVCKPFPEWSDDRSWEGGWLAGMFDGEGCLCKPNCKQGGIQLSIAQNPGQTRDDVVRLLEARGTQVNTHAHGPACSTVRVLGTSGEKLALLGSLRANRLISKFEPEMLGRLQQTNGGDRVVSVVPCGTSEIVLVDTSTQTMIVEGYAHHNCHYFANPNTGKPIGGTITNRLAKIGTTFVQGHVQGLLQGNVQFATGITRHGIVAGSAYLHDESFKGVANAHWRGIVVLNEVRDGDFCEMPLSLDYLCRKYTGKPLDVYMRKNYKNAALRFMCARAA